MPWSIRAAEAGKHVLCEKPIALTVAETSQLIEARDRTGVKIAEAFMVRTHPQWLRAIVGAFSYFNRDPKNVRNVPEWGGGALMDICCYPIVTARLLFGEEPVNVMGLLEMDPEFAVDRLTSAVMAFLRPGDFHLQHAGCTFPANANFRHEKGASKWKLHSTRRRTAPAVSRSTRERMC